jgi:hypothetical protein
MTVSNRYVNATCGYFRRIGINFTLLEVDLAGSFNFAYLSPAARFFNVSTSDTMELRQSDPKTSGQNPSAIEWTKNKHRDAP